MLTKLPINYPKTLVGVASRWDSRLSASSKPAQVILRGRIALNAVVCETISVDSYTLGETDRKFSKILRLPSDPNRRKAGAFMLSVIVA